MSPIVTVSSPPARSTVQEFVGAARWVHLDIAGPAFADKDLPYVPKGGTGFGVRLLLRYLSELAADPERLPARGQTAKRARPKRRTAGAGALAGARAGATPIAGSSRGAGVPIRRADKDQRKLGRRKNERAGATASKRAPRRARDRFSGEPVER